MRQTKKQHSCRLKGLVKANSLIDDTVDTDGDYGPAWPGGKALGW